jgi:prepilin-type N-terminal cleavage/methylation domain-containing protein
MNRILKRLPDPFSSPVREDGFTLIELLLVLGVIGILMGGISGAFDNLSRLSTKENAKASTQLSTRFGMETMIQDIQLAGLNPLGAPGAGFIVATATAIQIASDLNFDGDFSDSFENTTYALNGSHLEQTNHLGTETLVDNVSGFSFTYFDRNGTLIPEPVHIPDIRSVEISVTQTRDSGRGNKISRTYRTRIRCRNL